MNTVSVYGVQGWIEDLQPLGRNRQGHACASFLSAGERVKSEFQTSQLHTAGSRPPVALLEEKLILTHTPPRM